MTSVAPTSACSVSASSTTPSGAAAASSRSLAAACTRTGTHISTGTPTPVKANTACSIDAHRQLCGSHAAAASLHSWAAPRGSQQHPHLAAMHEEPLSAAAGAIVCCSMQQHLPPVAAVQQKRGGLLMLETGGWLSSPWQPCLPGQPEALQNRNWTCCVQALGKGTQKIATILQVSPVQPGRETALQNQLTPAHWPRSLPEQRPAQLRGLHQLLQPTVPGRPLQSWQRRGSAQPPAGELLRRWRSALRQTPAQQQGTAGERGQPSRMLQPAACACCQSSS